MKTNISPLIEHLEQFEIFVEKEILEIERLANRKEFKKNEYFLVEGQKAESVAFILKGGVRMYYLSREGKIHVKAFNFAGEFFSGYTSLLTRKPSNHSIQFLADTELLVFNYAEFEKSFCFEKFKKIERELIQKEYIEKEHREYTFLTMTATDRYLDFLKQYHKNLKLITSKDISSFLGLEPASLSRIKKMIDT